MRHSAAVFEDKRYDLSHKSIVDDSKSVTAAKKRKIWHLKRKKGLQSVHFTPKA